MLLPDRKMFSALIRETFWDIRDSFMVIPILLDEEKDIAKCDRFVSGAISAWVARVSDLTRVSPGAMFQSAIIIIRIKSKQSHLHPQESKGKICN